MHVDNKGIIDGLRKRERECIKPKAGDADLWIKIWEELHLLAARVEVEHVKAHRTKKDKKKLSWQKQEQCRFMAEAKAKTVQQEREEMYAALQHAASFHCLVEAWKDCEELRPKPKEVEFRVSKRQETKHRAEWCAEAIKYRCMRCGRGSKYMMVPRKCIGPKYLSENLVENGKKQHLGGHDLVRRMDRQGGSSDLVREMLGTCEAKNGTEIDELLQVRPSGDKGVRQNVETNSDSRRRQGSCHRGQVLEI